MKILAIALSVAFFVVGLLYWKGTLQIGASHPGPHHSHGVLFMILAILSLIWSRFQPTNEPTAASGAK